MAENKITDLAYRKLKATDKVQMVSDGGGLYVRVRANTDGGAKSFMFDYRFDGKQSRITLNDANSLVEARKIRDVLKQMIKQGKDPRMERQLETERNRAAQLAEQAELARQQAVVTVSGLYDRWIMTDMSERKDLAEVKRMIEKDMLPILGGLSVGDVRKGHITDVIDRIKQRGSKSTARNLLKLMRQLFRYAVDMDIIEFDPTASLSVSKVTTKSTERERVLSEEEIRLLKRNMPAAGFMPSTECAIWIMLSTLCRVGELSKAEWSHIDFDAKTFFIPVENAKNSKAHTIHLSEFALSQFQRLAQFKNSDRWLFPNTTDTNHVCEKSITKQIDGRQNPKIHSNRSKANDVLVMPGGKWTSHDLRRTGATMMGNLGVHSDVIEKCLNHTEANSLKRTYQHQKLKAEQAEAWRLLGDRLALLTGNSTNVVTFKRAL